MFKKSEKKRSTCGMEMHLVCVHVYMTRPHEVQKPQRKGGGGGSLKLFGG